MTVSRSLSVWASRSSSSKLAPSLSQQCASERNFSMQPLVRLAQPVVVLQLHQRTAHQDVDSLAVTANKVHSFAALNKNSSPYVQSIAWTCVAFGNCGGHAKYPHTASKSEALLHIINVKSNIRVVFISQFLHEYPTLYLVYQVIRAQLNSVRQVRH